LRSMIERAHKRESDFRKAAEEFLKHAQEAINPSLTEADVREMLIQHILTEDVFAAVFPARPFIRTTMSPANCTSWRRLSSRAIPSTRR
jgi:predicted helicase